MRQSYYFRPHIQTFHLLQILFLIRIGEGLLPLRQATCNIDADGGHGSISSSPASTESSPPQRLKDLSVAIIGAGPGGLLLAHQLAQSGAKQIHVYEQRSRYTTDSSRAYALGVGIRGRTALQRANLWDRVVKPIGYESDRFVLHAAGIQLKLRDKNTSPEPSLLLYQSDICRVLADALEKEHASAVQLNFDCGVTQIDLHSNAIFTSDTTKRYYDLIVGCDGVNSIVRKSMQDFLGPVFQSDQTLLPGVFKVARLPQMPPKLDPNAVQLLLPTSASVTAFCEPVIDGACCLLVAGNDETDVLLKNYEDPNDFETIKSIQAALTERFPKLESSSLNSAAQQLAAAKQGKASKVTCNLYHGKTTCLVGDAAHATGGVSGQGLNSALTDTTALVESLCENYNANAKVSSLEAALLQYSQIAVPEGKALYDLSFEGRGNVFTLVRDFVFQGRFGIGQPLLQTQLTTSLEPFADIRRERQNYFDEKFPSPEEWKIRIESLVSAFPQIKPK